MRKVVRRNFARLQLAKGFRQERLPEVSGFTQQFISRLERARRDATVVTLYHFAQALGVSHVGLNARSRSLARSARVLKRKKS
jgi:transcriptional regulator with XRE-family HTH domain